LLAALQAYAVDLAPAEGEPGHAGAPHLAVALAELLEKELAQCLPVAMEPRRAHAPEVKAPRTRGRAQALGADTRAQERGQADESAHDLVGSDTAEPGGGVVGDLAGAATHLAAL